MESVRGFRPRQKGVECSVEGCLDWCVSLDLCGKHRAQVWRKTLKGQVYTKEYNKRYKRPDIDKVCGHCKEVFVTARKAQVLCSGCSKSHQPSYSQKASRKRNPEKHKANDIVSKRLKRGVSLFRGPCTVCGSTEDIHAHHEDYSKPLEIIWLCGKHHRELHLRKGEIVLI